MTLLELEIKVRKKERREIQPKIENYWVDYRARRNIPPKVDQEYTHFLKVDRELREKRFRAFFEHLAKAHRRGKIHCRKLTKTDLPLPGKVGLFYRNIYTSERFPEPGAPHPLRNKAQEIHTLEDQKNFIHMLCEEVLRWTQMGYGDWCGVTNEDAWWLLEELNVRD